MHLLFSVLLITMSSESTSKQEQKRKAPTNGGQASKKSKKISSAPQRTENNFQVADEMIRSLVSVKASSLFPGDSSIYVCARTDKLVDVWQVRILNLLSDDVGTCKTWISICTSTEIRQY